MSALSNKSWTSHPEETLIVYYDASCPLCRTEMHTLKKADRQGRIELRDCSTKNFSDPYADADGISQADMMKAMHVRATDGSWHRGVDGFIQVYQAVGIHRMAKIWAHPMLKPTWERLYPWIAKNRQKAAMLGLHVPFGWLVRLIAGTPKQNLGCRDDRCAPPNDG